MKVFDSHYHFSESGHLYDLELHGRNLICNSLGQFDYYLEQKQENDSLTLLFENSSSVKRILEEAQKGNQVSIKLHTRLSNLRAGSINKLFKWIHRLPEGHPIVFDAFYYGSNLAEQPSLSDLIELAQEFPRSPIVVAHAGGYRILEYFFHLREFDNIYYDLSFSLQYLADTSVRADICKLLKYTPSSRIMFGTDFPEASPKKQLEILIEMFDELMMAEEDRMNILYDTAVSVYCRDT